MLANNFNKATFFSVLAALVVFSIAVIAIKHYGKYRQYTYTVDADGNPTGKTNGVVVCTFGKAADYTPKN